MSRRPQWIVQHHSRLLDAYGDPSEQRWEIWVWKEAQGPVHTLAAAGTGQASHEAARRLLAPLWEAV